MKNKMENVKLIKVCCDTSIEYLNYQGWHFEGIAIYKIGMKKYKCKFIAGEKLSFKCAFLEGGNIPQERLQREALLVLIYGKKKRRKRKTKERKRRKSKKNCFRRTN